MGPLFYINTAIYKTLDAFALWLWDRHAIHIKWPVRLLMLMSITMAAASRLLVGHYVAGLLVVGLWSPLGCLLDYQRYGADKPKAVTNMTSLHWRSSTPAVVFRAVWLALILLLAVLSFGQPLAWLRACGDFMWLGWIMAIYTIIPMKPPRRKKKLALPKLKLPAITLPGVQPVGAGAK